MFGIVLHPHAVPAARARLLARSKPAFVCCRGPSCTWSRRPGRRGLVERFGQRAWCRSGSRSSRSGSCCSPRQTVDANYPVRRTVADGHRGAAWASSPRRRPAPSCVRCRCHKAGVGSAVNDTTRELGGALGVAVMGSVVASLYRGATCQRPRLRPRSSLGRRTASGGGASRPGRRGAGRMPPGLRTCMRSTSPSLVAVGVALLARGPRLIRAAMPSTEETGGRVARRTRKLRRRDVTTHTPWSCTILPATNFNFVEVLRALVGPGPPPDRSRARPGRRRGGVRSIRPAGEQVDGAAITSRCCGRQGCSRPASREPGSSTPSGGTISTPDFRPARQRAPRRQRGHPESRRAVEGSRGGQTARPAWRPRPSRHGLRG